MRYIISVLIIFCVGVSSTFAVVVITPEKRESMRLIDVKIQRLYQEIAELYAMKRSIRTGTPYVAPPTKIWSRNFL